MYNRITLIGTLANDPGGMYDPEGNMFVLLSLKVPPPPDAPPTYWGLVHSFVSPEEEPFLIVCRDHLLIERCLQSFHQGDVVCVEGRLVLTHLYSKETITELIEILGAHFSMIDGLMPLAEILASDVILLTEHASEQKDLRSSQDYS